MFMLWWYAAVSRVKVGRCFSAKGYKAPHRAGEHRMSKIAVDVLVSRIENVIQVHRDAEDLTIGEVIGVLEIIKLDLYQETVDGQG